MLNTQILRKTIAYFLCAVPLLALLVSNTMFFPFITGKNFAFRIIALIVAGLWVVLMVKDPSARPKKHPITLAYTAFILVMIAATIFSVAPFRSFWSNFERMDGLVNHLHLYAFYLVAVSVLKREDWRRFFGVSIAASVASMGYAVFQLAHVFTITQGGIRLESTLGNAIYFGSFLLCNLFLLGYWLREREEVYMAKAILAGLLLTALPVLRFGGQLTAFFQFLSQNGNSKTFTLISLVLALLAAGGYWAVYSSKQKALWIIAGLTGLSYLFFIYKSGSRGILIGLVLGLIATGVVMLIGATGRARSLTIRALLVGIALVVLLGAISQTSLAGDSPVLARLRAGSVIETIQTRTTLWQLGIRAGLDRPVLGWGPETFLMAFSKHYDPVLFGEEPWFDRSHNVFVDYFVHTGVLGLAAYLALFGAAFYTLYKSATLNPAEKAILVGLLVAYIGQNITVFDNLLSYIFFFSLLAFIVSRVSPTEDTLSESELAPGMLEGVAVVMLVLVVGGIFGVHGKGIATARGVIRAVTTTQQLRENVEQNRLLVSGAIDEFTQAIGNHTTGLSEVREQYVQYAGQLISNTQVPEDLRIRVANEALKNILEEANREELNARPGYFYGLLLRAVGQPEEALQAFAVAQDRSPKKQLFMIERAITLSDLGRNDEALTLLAEARGLTENSFDNIDAVYAAIALTAGRPELLDDITTPSVFLDNRVLGLLIQAGQFERLEGALEAVIEQGSEGYERYLQLAEVYLRQQKTDEALAIINRGIVEVPEHKAEFEQALQLITNQANQ